jgi:glyoxylase-like metal-dependent hydrolase (beta-lactamase superfamily II)
MQIAPGLFSLSQRKGGRVHAYLLEDGTGLTLIDTLYDDDARVIFDELKEMKRSPGDIKRVLLSHAHKSHLGGLSAIQSWSGAPVYAHEAEAPIVEGEQKAAKVGWQMPKPFNLEVLVLQAALNAGIGRHEPTKVHQRLKEGDKIGPVEVIGAPGHTLGSVAFWWPEQRALITGDSVASWPVVDAGWPSFNLDHAQAKHSIAKMAELNPQILCVGHGEPIMSDGGDILYALSQM